MVEENWVVNADWKNRQQAKNAVIRRNCSKVMLIPHPNVPKTWIEVPSREKEERDKYGFNKEDPQWETSDDILNEVSDYTGIPVKDICEKTRKRIIVEPRQVAMYMAKRRTKESLSEIGFNMGGKDHATVLHACKTVKNLLETDKIFSAKWGKLTG